MRRSVEVLESRLTTLYRYRDMMDASVNSALRSSAPHASKASIRANAAKWDTRWRCVHDKAWALWVRAGGVKS